LAERTRVESNELQGGPQAGSRASSPGEQAAACDCQIVFFLFFFLFFFFFFFFFSSSS